MNSSSLPYIIIGIVVLAALALIFAVHRSKTGQAKPDYRTMFIMGVVWLPAGVALDNPGLWGMGIVFMIAGLVNKDKWEEEKKWADLTPQEQKTKLIIAVGLGVLVLVGLVVYFMAR